MKSIITYVANHQFVLNVIQAGHANVLLPLSYPKMVYLKICFQ